MLLTRGGRPAQCFARIANVRAKPEPAREVRGHAPRKILEILEKLML